MEEQRRNAVHKSLALSDIPGLAEAMAVAKGNQLVTRENSLLNLTYDIFGFKVRTMTVRDYVLLERFRSPFISRVEPTLDDLSFFLWALSPQFNKWLGRKWLGWLQPVAALFYGCKVRKAFGSKLPDTSEPAVVKCFEYIDTMFYDSPPALTKGGESCLCYLTGWFDAIQSEYHFPSEQVWAMGLPELFQRLNAIRQRRNPSAPTFNKGTDQVKIFILSGLRSKEFTMEDLAKGKVKIPVTFLSN